MRFHITRADAERNADTNNNDADIASDGGRIDMRGATITGGVFGGVNTGIKGGVFHGRVIVENDDDQ
ncbi:hypothetical protein [Streptomyces sp. NPDC057682]|uniref:hypothetical protein n=1 Tax=Streptomyces sp. NPDC057682 TaxID=3346210 RepID=UPI0036BFBCFF